MIRRRIAALRIGLGCWLLGSDELARIAEVSAIEARAALRNEAGRAELRGCLDATRTTLLSPEARRFVDLLERSVRLSLDSHPGRRSGSMSIPLHSQQTSEPLTYVELLPGPRFAASPSGIALLVRTMDEAGITVPPEQWPEINVIAGPPVPVGVTVESGRFEYERRNADGSETGRIRITMRLPSSDAHWRHVLRHEIGHYRQYLRGERSPFDEVEAESFAGEYECDLCCGGNVERCAKCLAGGVHAG